jgi:hypothetical protein
VGHEITLPHRRSGTLLVAIQVARGQYTPRIIATTLLRDTVSPSAHMTTKIVTVAPRPIH